MRSYGTVTPSFWRGQTGRDIRGLGPAAQLVALYLMTAPDSNLIGLYYLPLLIIAHEANCQVEEARFILDALAELDWAFYDLPTETVWVKNMAFYQIAERVKRGDNRWRAIVEELGSYDKSPFFNRFLEVYGEPFNLNSPTQLGAILFGKLGYKPVKYTGKTKAPSTDEDVLQELAEKQGAEIASELLRHRQMVKLLGTYVEALPLMVNPITGRVHTRLHQAAVASGRLASSDPNLQNIPIRTEEGRAIRGAFVPEPGWVLLDADYSQIELRVVAALAGDPVLLGAFEAGEDIHRRTASEVFNVPMDQVTSDQRSASKAVNFGLLYGQGAFALAANIGVSQKEAKAFIERYFERMPRVAAWIEGAKEKALAEGLVRTHWGRIRRIPYLESSNRNDQNTALREAVNTIVQGTAADLMRRAMVRLHRSLLASGLKARLLLQVHDELLMEAPQEEVEREVQEQHRGEGETHQRNTQGHLRHGGLSVVARAGGMTAYALVTASVALGLALSMRWQRPIWPRMITNELHSFVTLLSLVFVVVHVCAIWIDPYLKFSWPHARRGGIF